MRNNIVAIIQARMGSVRLPGKVLADIENRPMLWHVVERLKACRRIDKIVVATTIDGEDDIIEEFCRKYGISFYRGNKNDVLERYYQAAKANLADVIIRITADCPLIDPVVTDKVVADYLKNSKSFAGASNIIRRTYPRGLDTEVFAFSALEKARELADKDYEREHVTTYFYEHKDLFRFYSVEAKEDASHLRWTVDEEKDLEFARQVYARLYHAGRAFLSGDVLRLLEKEPAIGAINQGVKQKAII